MAAKRVVLEVRGIRVERARTILGGIDWTVRRGEHWAVIGPNGSGKTSLLKVCCGYLPETAGTVRDAAELAGRDGDQSRRERIGLLSHSLQACIEPHQTVAEVLHSGRRNLLNDWAPIARAEQGPLRRILRQVRLAEAAEQLWSQLSQGERQRALLGRALWSKVPLLFLDEPCAGLDPVAREAFLNHLEAFCGRRGGPSAVLVTHHVEEILPAITHVLLLREGRVVAQGPKGAVMTSANFSEAFSARVNVRRAAGDRYRLIVTPPNGRSWF